MCALANFVTECDTSGFSLMSFPSIHFSSLLFVILFYFISSYFTTVTFISQRPFLYSWWYGAWRITHDSHAHCRVGNSRLDNFLLLRIFSNSSRRLFWRLERERERKSPATWLNDFYSYSTHTNTGCGSVVMQRIVMYQVDQVSS